LICAAREGGVRRRIREVSSIYATRERGKLLESGGELKPRHQRGEGTSNHVVREGRGHRTTDRGGGLDPCCRRGEVRSNCVAERILWLPSVPIIIIILNIFFTSNQTGTVELHSKQVNHHVLDFSSLGCDTRK
jgi:hypothetical protein